MISRLWKMMRHHDVHYNEMLHENKEMVDKENQKMLERLTILSAVIHAINIFFCLTTSTFRPMLFTYTVMFFITIVGLLIVFCFTRKNNRWITPIALIFFIIFLAYGCLQPIINYNSGTTMIGLVVALLILPLLIITNNALTAALLLATTTAFSVLAWIFLPEQALDYTINAVTAMLIGMVTGDYVRNIRMEAIENQRLLKYERDHDALTGLYNRRKLFEELARYDEEKLQNKLMMIMLDIDYFKAYNDTYGHVAGDLCLKQVCDTMILYAKQNGFKVYRFGGEEFLFIGSLDCGDVKNCSAKEVCTQIAALNIPHKTSKFKIVTVSVGCVSTTAGDFTSNEMIELADKALYRAKGQGRNQACCANYMR